MDMNGEGKRIVATAVLGIITAMVIIAFLLDDKASIKDTRDEE